MRTQQDIGHKPGVYALRRTLPSWRFDETLDELLGFCQRTHTDEIIVKVDTEEFSHGIPTIQWLEDYLPYLHRTRDALNAIGVTYSLNPWTTQNHCDRGKDLREIYPDMHWMVGHDGTQCHACACPLSNAWREHTTKLWQLYSSTKPQVMWVEDDIRTFNHEPITFGCFCDSHLQAMSEIAGRQLTREDLVSAILAPGKPDPLRTMWLDFQRQTMLDVARVLSRAVLDTDREIFIGLMSSGPNNHCMEGRYWHDFAKALDPDKPIYSRPPLGNYNENSLRGLYYSSDMIKLTRHVLPAGTIEQSEVENWPFTGYSKSATFSFLQLALSAALGSEGATMNFYDHIGTPLAVEPNLEAMLAGKRAFIDAIIETHQPRQALRGVRLLHHERASYTKQLKAGGDHGAMGCTDYAWQNILNSLGIATTFDESNVVALNATLIDCFSDEEISEILSSGVLIDLHAAETLIARGFGEQIGIVEVQKTGGLNRNTQVSVEEMTDPDFGGAPLRFSTMSLPSLSTGETRVAWLTRAKGTRVISRILDKDNKVIADFTTLYENSLGGRVAVVPMDISESSYAQAYLNSYRRQQLTAVLNWLSRDTLPLSVSGDGVYPLVYRMDFADHTVAGVFNLSLDDWQEVKLTLATGDRKITKAELLAADGTWQDAPGTLTQSDSKLELTMPITLTCKCPAIVRFS